jgi:ATP-dependent DNA helicase RecG
MFGTDEIIQSATAGCKFDAILRQRDLDRYDDRVMVRTNLIDSFDLLMAFVEKHLNDPFYVQGTTRVSLRSKIFRELVSNIIAHREYTSAQAARMIIYSDRVVFDNPCVPNGHGRIDPNHFTPKSKNPTICKFMIQMGRYEELGSGISNVSKYLPLYADGALPTFDEGDTFTATVPLSRSSTGVTMGVTGEVARLIEAMDGERGSRELRDKVGLRNEEHFRLSYLRPALEAGFIEMPIPDKPNSRMQKYRLTAKGRQALGQADKAGRHR